MGRGSLGKHGGLLFTFSDSPSSSTLYSFPCFIISVCSVTEIGPFVI